MTRFAEALFEIAGESVLEPVAKDDAIDQHELVALDVLVNAFDLPE